MSLFPDLEVLAKVFNYADSDTTKISTIEAKISSDNYDFTIKLNLIQPTLADEILGDTGSDLIPDFWVNARGDNAENIKMGAVIKINSELFKVTEKPKYLKLFQRYRMKLKSTHLS